MIMISVFKPLMAPFMAEFDNVSLPMPGDKIMLATKQQVVTSQNLMPGISKRNPLGTFFNFVTLQHNLRRVDRRDYFSEVH